MEKIPRLALITGSNAIPKQKKVARLVRVPFKNDLHGTIVSEGIYSMPTHHVGKRTVLCPGEETCLWHEDQALKWYGIVAIWDRLATGPVWVQLTPEPAQSLKNEIEHLQLPFFNTCVKIGRLRPVYNAPIWAKVMQNSNVGNRMLKPLLPDETLKLVFGSPNSTPLSNGEVVE